MDFMVLIWHSLNVKWKNESTIGNRETYSVLSGWSLKTACSKHKRCLYIGKSAIKNKRGVLNGKEMGCNNRYIGNLVCLRCYVYTSDKSRLYR